MRSDGWDYLTSIWNYIDIITPTTVFTLVCVKATNIHIGEETERIVQAIGVFFMWFKFLYFFRIFEPTAYLIRMIVTVIASMKYFFLVLAVTIIGFGNAFLVIAMGNP